MDCGNDKPSDYLKIGVTHFSYPLSLRGRARVGVKISNCVIPIKNPLSLEGEV